MAVTHNPAGFTGTVDQIAEARRLGLSGGGRFKVAGQGDWALSANSGTNRTVTIATGMAQACGVLDTTTAADTVSFAANGGGTDRYDAIVATFDWSNMTISFRVIAGTTVPPVIVNTGTTVDPLKINWLPGTRYDAVLGVVRARPGVTILAPADLYDCRVWGAWSSLNILSSAVLSVVDGDPNSRVRDLAGGTGKQEYVKQLDGSWAAATAGSWVQMTQAAYNGLAVKDPSILYVIVG